MEVQILTDLVTIQSQVNSDLSSCCVSQKPSPMGKVARSAG